MTKLRFLFVFSIATTSCGWIAVGMIPARADAGLKCPADPAQSVVQARKALAANDPKQDRVALVCLADAVASLDRKLEGLRDGSVPFTGRIDFPRGFKFPQTKGHK